MLTTFEIRNRLNLPAYIAANCAVLKPLNSTDGRPLPERIANVQAQWRRRLSALQSCNWSGLGHGKKVIYAKNCPPCGVFVSPQRMPCLLRVCPFCHGRKVIELLERIAGVVSASGPVVVEAYRELVGYNDAGSEVKFGVTGYLDDTFCSFMRKQQARRQELQYSLEAAMYVIYWYSIAPWRCYNETEHSNAQHWISQHGYVAVLPVDWPVRRTKRKRSIRNPKPYQLGWLLGHAFKYRTEYLRSNPTILCTLLEATKGEKFLSYMKRTHICQNHEIDRTTQQSDVVV